MIRESAASASFKGYSAANRARRAGCRSAHDILTDSRAMWDVWVDELETMQLDHRPDGAMLVGACESFEQAVEADEMIKRDGMIVDEYYVDNAGERQLLKRKSHPAVLIRDRAWRHVRSFCSEFGFSPASRVKLAVERPTAENSMEELNRILNAPRPPRDPVN